jgi:hypothetical protein
VSLFLKVGYCSQRPFAEVIVGCLFYRDLKRQHLLILRANQQISMPLVNSWLISALADNLTTVVRLLNHAALEVCGS